MMKLRAELLSSTAALEMVVPDHPLHAVDTYTGKPYTITMESLRLAFELAEESYQNYRSGPFISMLEMQELSRRLIPTADEARREEYVAIIQQLDTAESYGEFLFWWDAAAAHRLMYGDGTGRPTGIFKEKPRNREIRSELDQLWDFRESAIKKISDAFNLTKRRK